MINKKVNIFLLLPSILGGIALGYFLFRPAAGEKANPATPSGPATSQEYTCAMHPQIRQSGPGICPLCEMDLTPVENDGGSNDRVLTMTPEAVQLSNIQTMEVGAGPISERPLRMSGKIQADERRAAIQAAHVPGRIEALFVTFTGEKVQRGQALARIYSPALVSAQRELLEAVRLQGGQTDLAEAARNKIRSWKLPESFIREVETSGKIQRETVLRADRSGFVVSKKVSVGDYIEEGMPVLELMDLQKVWAILEAYESDLPAIKIGATVEISTPSAPAQLFPARVTFIDPLLDPDSRTVAIRAELDNTAGIFKPEMLIEAHLRTSTAKKDKTALLVPKTAILWTGKRSVVYVKVPDAPVPSFEFREVELGGASDEGYVVRSGLEPGERVVVQGAFVIDAAAQLNNQTSMMHRSLPVSQSVQAPIPDLRHLATPAFQQQWGKLLLQYLALKDALVATDSEAGKKAAARLLDALNQVTYQDLPFELRSYVQKNIGPLKAFTKAITEAKYVEDQRQQFLFLSEIIIRNLKTIGGSGQTLYLQHCPMAFNDKGGDWVSAGREVRNPYFGDEMLRCGIVKDSL
jgi:Cu(I)/Ag(I) efflux system membrane fusion protein